LPPPEASFAEANKWWFTPERIRRGVCFGNTASHNPQIRIDAERGIFYYKRAD